MTAARPVWALVLAMNEYERTRETLRAVLTLDPPADHVLLVDNGSSDGTETRAKAEFPGIEVLALEENRYFAGGVNAGLRRALDGGAGSVLLLNNDLVLERGALGHLLESLVGDPKRGAATPKIFYFDPPDRIWFAGGVVSPGFRLIRHRGLNRKDDAHAGPGGGAGDGRDPARPVDYVSGAAVLLSRNALETVGLLDESYVMYVEDVDWSTRARLAGLVLWYEPRARAWHHVSATSGGGLTPLKAYYRLRSGALYLSRYAKSWERPLAWLAYVAWTKGLLLRTILRGDGRTLGALLLGLVDFTRILLGATPPVRRPETFARPSPRR